MSLLPICILAGGAGSRLGNAVTETPKPLLEIAGKPFIAHQLEALKAHGASEVVICTGYLGWQFEEVLGGGERYGLRIRYSDDGKEPLGTGGAIKNALTLLGSKFFVLYGDTYLHINYTQVQRKFESSSCSALLTVMHNRNAFDKSNAVVQGDLVVEYDKRHPSPLMQWIDYGLAALSGEVVELLPNGYSDLSDLYRKLAENHLLVAFPVTERFHEIGTPESLEETSRFLEARTADAAE